MSELVWGLDVSSHQPRDLSGIIAEHRPQHMIVRLYLPIESPPQEHTKAQVASCRANGVSVGGYLWAYRSASPSQSISAAIDLCAQMDLVLPILWIDCETYANSDAGPDTRWLREAIGTANALQTKVGIYTGAWWVQQHFPGGFAEYREFADLPHWIAEYGDPGYGLDVGWGDGYLPNVVARQWSADPLDKDILLPSYAYVEAPQPPAPPPPEPPQPPDPDLAARVAGLEQCVSNLGAITNQHTLDLAALEAFRERLKQAVEAP